MQFAFSPSLKGILALCGQLGYAVRARNARNAAREYRMSMVENLLRLHRWQLEERRRYLGELESLAERLRVDAVRLTDNDAGAERLDPPRPRAPAGGAFGRN